MANNTRFHSRLVVLVGQNSVDDLMRRLRRMPPQVRLSSLSAGATGVALLFRFKYFLSDSADLTGQPIRFLRHLEEVCLDVQQVMLELKGEILSAGRITFLLMDTFPDI